jgi:hypothetical protein
MIASNGLFKYGSQDVSKVYKGNILIWEKPNVEIEIENLTLKLNLEDTISPSYYWFNAYKSTDFPEVVCDKNYFFLYSTDHSSGAGGLYWGKGNDLGLSDFIEIGLILSGYQAETPRLIRIPFEECGDSEVLHLFYHTLGTDPGNSGKQQTRLITSVGGTELHLMTWTDRGRPLGIVGSENHTGYLFPYKLSANNYIGTHIITSGLPQPWYYSTSTNGRTWIRGSQIDTTTNVLSSFFTQVSLGLYFNKFEQQWWIGQIYSLTGGELGGAGVGAMLALCKATNFDNLTHVKLLRELNDAGDHSVYIDGDVAHIYIIKGANQVYHGTCNLNNLENYL